jgi:hypothetical protein
LTRILNPFAKNGCTLLYPLSRKVPAGQTQAFAVKMPGALEAFVQQGKSRTSMPQAGDLFVGQATLEPGPVQLFARFAEGSNYSGVLEFTAE